MQPILIINIILGFLLAEGLVVRKAIRREGGVLDIGRYLRNYWPGLLWNSLATVSASFSFQLINYVVVSSSKRLTDDPELQALLVETVMMPMTGLIIGSCGALLIRYVIVRVTGMISTPKSSDQ